MVKAEGSPVIYSELLKEIDRVKSKIESMKELYGVDLSRECLDLLHICYVMAKDWTHSLAFAERFVQGCKLKTVRVEYSACNVVLTKLIERFSAYAKELEESLINTGDLRKAINEAKRHQITAHATSNTDEGIEESVKILNDDIEALSAAQSIMVANEPEEKRRIAFRLVEIFIGYLGILVACFIAYAVGYPNSEPFSSQNFFALGAVFLLGCIAIYAAIGAIAKVRHK
jgi:hypothetical protein